MGHASTAQALAKEDVLWCSRFTDIVFFYRYMLRLGFLDGVPGLIYCGFQSIQMFHTKAKMYELKGRKDRVFV